MAHVGRIYKLWYRRDAAWDLDNYEFAYPEAFRLTVHRDISSTKYRVSEMEDVLAVNTSKEYSRVWTSPTVGGFFDNAYWSVEILDPPDEQIETFRFRIFHAAIIDVPLYDATYTVRHHPGAYSLIQGGALRILHWLSPDIQTDPERLQPDFTAARWDEYPLP